MRHRRRPHRHHGLHHRIHHHHGPPWHRGPPGGRAMSVWRVHARLRRRLFAVFGIATGLGAAAGAAAHAATGGRWWAVAVTIGFLWMASGGIAWRLTRPLLQVIDAARAIGSGDLSTRIPVGHHRGELAILADAINDMAARIEKQLADQRQLLAAVSHELRTPLGHVRVLLDTARDAPGGPPPALLDEIERELLDLDRLVDRLLASSRLDFATVDRRRTAIGDLAVTALEQLGVAPELLTVDGEVEAEVDPTLVRRAIANLVENADRHGGGAVAIRVERRGDDVVVEVDDAGPGVSAETRARLFAPFERGDAAGGLGLGLALVSRIAAAHGGRAWLDDRPGGGSRAGFSVAVSPEVRP